MVDLSRRFRIIVDIDNTIGDLSKAWTDRLNIEHDLDAFPSKLTSYNMMAAYPSLTRNEVYAPLSDTGFWRTVEPVFGAVDALDHLNDRHDIYLCTASNYKSLERKYEDFVQKWFPFIDWSQIIICEDKWLIRGDIFIDDYPLNLQFNHHALRKFLFDQPYNRRDVCPPGELRGLFRVYGWEEIVRRIEELTE